MAKKYVDFDKTRSEIEDLWNDEHSCNEIYNSGYDKAIDDVLEILDEQPDAEAIIPPCKIGDVVFAAKGHFYLPHAINIKSTDLIRCEVVAIKVTKQRQIVLLKPIIYERYGKRSAYKWFPFSAFGKTIRKDGEEL